MAKTINRTIINTNAVVKVVNTVDETFTDRNVTLCGNYDEQSLLKELNKGKTFDEFYAKVIDLNHDTVMYSMTAQEFMLHGTQGLKPTTRTRYVTTHIKSTVATVLVVNKDDEVERLTIDITGMSKAKIRKSVESDGYVFVKVLETETKEEPWYMTEEFFIANATANEV